MQWEQKRLEELVHAERPITYGVVKPGEQPLTGGVTLIRGGDILSGRIANELRTIQQSLSDRYRRTLLNGGELVVSLVGNPGEVAIVPKTLAGANLARQAGLVALNEDVDARYVMYALMAPTGRQALAAVTKGSVQKVINLADLKRVPVLLPPKAAQMRISSILGAYDDLIDINRRRIALLEEMTRRLFEEWFVRFRFPGHENVAINDTPDGPLPEGWAVVPLGEALANLQAGARPKGGIRAGVGEVPSIGAENINGLGRYDYTKEKLIERSFFESMRRGVVQSGDVLLYKDGAHIGRKAMFRDAYPYQECAVNEHVFILRPTPPVSPAYLYFWLDQSGITSKIKALNSNAAQPGINQVGVSSLPLLLPDRSFVEAFTRAVEPMLALLFSCAKSIRQLALSRDLLLPRLISGQLALPAAERQVEDAAIAAELVSTE